LFIHSDYIIVLQVSPWHGKQNYHTCTFTHRYIWQIQVIEKSKVLLFSFTAWHFPCLFQSCNFLTISAIESAGESRMESKNISVSQRMIRKIAALTKEWPWTEAERVNFDRRWRGLPCRRWKWRWWMTRNIGPIELKYYS
jgi:hypothetical protein